MSDALWKTLQARKNGQDTIRLNKFGVFHYQGIRRNRYGDGVFSVSWSSGVHLYAKWYPWPAPPEMRHET